MPHCDMVAACLRATRKQVAYPACLCVARRQVVAEDVAVVPEFLDDLIRSTHTLTLNLLLSYLIAVSSEAFHHVL
jgi:hypothetical protein